MNNKEKVNNAFETLKQGVIELINDPLKLEVTLANYGDNYQYNTYSSRNTMILMFETMLRKGKQFQMARGYKQWKTQFNRKVKKGEKAIYILAPQKKKYVKKDEKTEEEIVYYKTYFKAIPVFELSQTEGDPIPRTNKNHEYKSLNDLNINEFIERCGVPVEWEDLISANGYTDGTKIVLGTHNDNLAAICTLFHELAHYHLHFDNGNKLNFYSNDSVNFKELEAETVSYMVSSALGIENSYSKKYIAAWNKSNKNLDKEFVERSYKLLMEALKQIDLFIDLVNA